jgi:Lrp/AsnC family leucine-responsive transcriptional regulator
MDVFDAKLLKLVQHNNKATTEQLAEAVGLSPSACQRRLKRLRESGTIVADMAVVTPEAVGRRFTAILRVTLDTVRPDVVDRFKRSVLSRPEIMQCYNTTGAVAFVLLVTARDMDDYDRISRRLFEENPAIRRFETNIVLDRAKVSLAVPIDEDDFKVPGVVSSPS